MPSEFEEGLMIGLLIGEGHFGGDGRQPQVTLRMHVRHEALMRWLDKTFPGGRVYGPYNHDGRHYFQWMARGSYLRDHLLPFLERGLSPFLDEHSWSRFDRMRNVYSRQLGAPPPPEDSSAEPPTRVPESPAPTRTREPHDVVPGTAEDVFERLRRGSVGTTWQPTG